MANTLHDSYDTMQESPEPVRRPSLEFPTAPQKKPATPTDRAKRFVVSMAVLGVIGTAGVYSWPHLTGLGSAKAQENWITEPAVKQRLVITVSEDGNIESAANVDVKCEILGGSTILWIVGDGKQVEEGEEIVRLDESAIDTQLNTQKIAAEKALALKIQAEQDYEAAKIAVEEYEKGLFVMEEQTLGANVKIAMENLRGAENLLNHTQVMFRKGFVTKQQLEADQFGVQRSELELKSAQTALKNLQEFTKLKMLTQLKAARDAAEARKRSEEAAWNLEVSNLKKLEAQKALCVIKAPQAGMVIHANERDRRSTEITIKEGAAVRERQSLIQLPDLTKMQVKAKVHESKIELLKIGMPARITVQDRVYKGKVIAVANQPEPGSWFSASVKEYAATVSIDGSIDGLKPGMTAEVEMFVADIPDALTVSVSAVVEQGNGKYAVWIVNDDGELERRPVVIGRTNENVIEIKDGILEGQQVVLNPRAVVEEAREEMEDETEEIPSGIPTGPDAGLSQGKPLAQAGQQGPNFKDLDKDSDGKLSKDEAPERMQQYFDRSDTDKDGFISLSEWAANQARRRQAQANGPGGPEGGAGGPQGGQGGPGGAKPGGTAIGGESE
jgi:RND family efflux transporter MFP subunit